MADDGAPPAEPAEIIQWVAHRWKGSDWGADGSARYMRPLGNSGWKARMRGLQSLVAAGDAALPALHAALADANDETRIFAAQTLGFVPSASSSEPLLAALRKDKSAPVRLYAADSLGMIGAAGDLKEELQAIRAKEENRDVKKHLGYALGRGANAIEPSIVEKLKNWDASNIDVAEIGKMAPDFELDALNGDTVRLSDFKGKSPVVLVFIYGDT